MDNERVRALWMALPHVRETVNWGHHLVYWVGDRDIGGKMFAMRDLDGPARAFWVTVERWDVLRPREFEEELRRAHALVYEKLPKRTKAFLATPEKERSKLIRERKEREKAKKK